jgi:putative transposase
MSRLRRLVLCDRYFFVTCRVHVSRRDLNQLELATLARAVRERRAAMRFLLTAWVLLPDHWHGIIFPPFPLSISRVMEAIKVSAAKLINGRRAERGVLFQGRFFDRALRTVKEYHEKLDYIHRNPVAQGLAARPEDWEGSSVHDFAGSMTTPPAEGSPIPVDRIMLPSDEQTRI